MRGLRSWPSLLPSGASHLFLTAGLMAVLMAYTWYSCLGSVHYRAADGSYFYYLSWNYYYIPVPNLCSNIHLNKPLPMPVNYDGSYTDASQYLSIYDLEDEIFCGKKVPQKESHACEGALPGMKCGGVATIYNVIPGGGEKYLLSYLRSMQLSGYFVDLLVLPTNTCQEWQCLISTAMALNVHLDYNRLGIRTVSRNSTHLDTGDIKYDLFALIGNTKIPAFAGSGKRNMYLNQFPFDGGRVETGRDISIMHSYQRIIFNSEYTHTWYSAYTKGLFRYMQLKGISTPVKGHVYPPVTLSSTGHTSVELRKMREPWILLTGRFFDGIQGKRHLEAIQVFKLLKGMISGNSKLEEEGEERDQSNQVPRSKQDRKHKELQTREYQAHSDTMLQNAQLFLVGYQMSGLKAQKYVDSIKQATKKVKGVHILTNIDSSALKALQQKTSIVWSLTGGLAGNPLQGHRKDNPADAEHFGISVVEAMSAGNIPIVTKKGGLLEIMRNESNQVASSSYEMALKTKLFLTMGEQDMHRRRAWARHTSELFGDNHFHSNMRRIIEQGR